jgi:hypothetical protein
MAWRVLALQMEEMKPDIEGKGKGHPRTGHEVPKGEQRYNSSLSLNSALDRGGWPTPRPGRFTPGKDTVR